MLQKQYINNKRRRLTVGKPPRAKCFASVPYVRSKTGSKPLPFIGSLRGFSRAEGTYRSPSGEYRVPRHISSPKDISTAPSGAGRGSPRGHRASRLNHSQRAGRLASPCRLYAPSGRARCVKKICRWHIVGTDVLGCPKKAPSGWARRVKKICRWHIVGTDVPDCPKEAPSGRELAPKVTEGACVTNNQHSPHPLDHRRRMPFYCLRVQNARADGSFRLAFGFAPQNLRNPPPSRREA